MQDAGGIRPGADGKMIWLEPDGTSDFGFFGGFDILAGVGIFFGRLQWCVAEVGDYESRSADLGGGRRDRLAGKDFIEAGY